MLFRSVSQSRYLRINWARDRFTSAGYEQQKGVAPALGGLGNLKIKPYGEHPIPDNGWIHKKENGEIVTRKSYLKTTKTTAQDGVVIMNLPDMPSNTVETIYPAIEKNFYAENGSAFNVSDLRLLIALQKAMEIDMRTGSRYFEYIKTNFNSSPRNDALHQQEV